RNARSGVAYLHPDEFLVWSRRYHDRRLWLTIFAGVHQQIHQNLLDLARIAAHAHAVDLVRNDPLPFAIQRRLNDYESHVERLTKFHRAVTKLKLTYLDLGRDGQIVDQRLQPGRATLDPPQEILSLSRLQPLTLVDEQIDRHR